MTKITKALTPHHGFSLLEIMLVTILIAVLAQFVGLNLIKQFPKQRLNRATRQMTWNLMAARSQAILQNRNIHILLSGTTTYTLWIDSNNNDSLDTGEEHLVQNIPDDYSDVSIDTSSVFFENPLFNSRGFATNVASIPLTNSSGSRTINIELSGFVSSN